jgi:hypothetical protein
MQKIDRLGWAAGLSVYSHGLRIGVRFNKPEVAEAVQERLPPGWEPGCSPFVEKLYSLRVGGRAGFRSREFTLLYDGFTQKARTMVLEDALDTLETEMQLHVAEWARNQVFLHAGVVGWRGRAILLPGRSMAGKSTLVAALLRAGATYYSDEFAVLDSRGRVHPYARRLSLRQDDRDKRLRPTAEDLGSEVGVRPLPIGLVVITRYQPGGRWHPQPMTPGLAMLELVDHAGAVQREPEMVMHTLEQALQGVTVLKGVRGEAEATAELLLGQAERTSVNVRELPALAS